MSRIKGIEFEADRILQSHPNGSNGTIKKKTKEQTTKKDNAEKRQIVELLHKLPRLDEIFEVHRKIGEGTFSSVYLGSLRQHAELPSSEKRWFAIKHLVPTVHPARIEHELRCLQDMGGKDHVIGVELCLRHLDTIVFVMPYIPHRKFSEYVGDMDANELRRYMRALMIALRRVHSFGVIHRDVKPGNFLYDRENQRYLLVDFGLAQRLCPLPIETRQEPASLLVPPPAHTNSNGKRNRSESDSPPGAKRVALDLTVAAKPKVTTAAAPAPASAAEIQSPRATPRNVSAYACACAGAGGVCAACEARPPPRAARAGTQGFRPPEVLLKYPHQTTAVDMWASGVVLVSVLSARYPFFRASDDVSALAELADLLGTQALQRTAAALGRRLVTSSGRRGLCLRKLCAWLRGAPPPPCTHSRLPRAPCLCLDGNFKPQEVRAGSVAGFPDAAFALAARLLEPDPRARLSAAEALRHPFLATGGERC
ncbi:cell division cycle 7-related protein kinase-like [Galleria mellonella]|uniref:non-specific serine/threonine protein kinase n=1 Tax=Galleria mellonella TaxID=7137 RepID=A0ABM3N5T7_GALME|nr:cell division cycle 7-related protein kinase-like [Galleria mellonella]XP_052758814.1 cell division cycle 7-related protein kinase-like [Galleria mellonella]